MNYSIQKLHRVMCLCVMFLVSCCFTVVQGCGKRSNGGKIALSKLTPEEEGNMTFLKPKLDSITKYFASAQSARQEYRNQKDAGNTVHAEQHFQKYFTSLSHLKGYLLRLKEAGSTPSLLPPGSFREVYSALLSFDALRHQVDPGPMSPNDQSQIYNIAGEVYFAVKRLAFVLNSRTTDYSGATTSMNFTAELGFLTVDFSKREVKVIHSWKTGPVKWSSGIGSGRSGIRTLIIQNSQGRRIFAIGEKPIEVRVQESVIRTEGNVMIVTAVE